MITQSALLDELSKPLLIPSNGFTFPKLIEEISYLGENYIRKKIIEFFDTGDFNFFPIFVIPAWLSFSSLKKHICFEYQKFHSFNVILTFCDHATKKEKRFYEHFLEMNYNMVIGYNSSGYLHKGLEITPVLNGLKLYKKNIDINI